MKEYKIEVNNNVVEYLERLSYEVTSRSDIITMLLENHKFDDDASVLESKAFKVYSEQLSQIKAEFEIAKAEFEQANIPSAFKGHNYEWNLDYKSCTLTIKLHCECEVTI